MGFCPSFRSSALAAGLLMLCVLYARPVTAQLVPLPPPAPLWVPAPPPPRMGYVWEDAHWEWHHGGYIWRRGHWRGLPTGRIWHPGRWVVDGRGWRWWPGYFE